VNEVAPRPHNSGHHTIESCYTSQYEQHLRAILGLPLGDPSMKAPAAIMYNILGEDEVTNTIFFCAYDYIWNILNAITMLISGFLACLRVYILVI
jgi:phosphoribosylaminoimidazole carboxylase